MRTTTLSTNCVHRLLARSALLFVPLLIGCLGFLPLTQAVSPPPDGGYLGGNTAEGENALLSLTTGDFNTAVGFWSLRSNTDGRFNTAVGAGTLLANDGDENTATGVGALLSNTIGLANTATGAFALFSNTIGTSNTAIGSGALTANTGGNANTATGDSALANNTTGSANTATGSNALFSNTDGADNTAIGFNALYNNTTGGLNTAVGSTALASNTSGYENSAFGYRALYNHVTGGSNNAFGGYALSADTGGFSNNAFGGGALLNNTGNSNTAIGDLAGQNLTTGNNNIDIGNYGVAAESNTIRIGTQGTQTATYVAGISGTTLANGIAVVVDMNTGQLGVPSSSERFKKDISTMDKGSEAILSLRPVTFHYKSDAKNIPQFGLIAEEVAKVNPDLVLRDPDGRIHTVRYEAVNAMLLNEFLKEHRTVQEQGAIIARQQKQIEALTAGLQRVSAQLEASKPAPQVVNNP